jgi:uncharacterized protein (DUF2164 family)
MKNMYPPSPQGTVSRKGKNFGYIIFFKKTACNFSNPSCIVTVNYFQRSVLKLFIKLKKEQQEIMISDIQHFFSQERDEEITEFVAEIVLDFVKEKLAPHFYNAAVLDVKHVVEQQFSSLEDEILTLERPIK